MDKQGESQEEEIEETAIFDIYGSDFRDWLIRFRTRIIISRAFLGEASH